MTVAELSPVVLSALGLCVAVAALARTYRARRAEQRVRAAGMAIVDADGVLREANDALCHLLGHAREELVGRRLADFVGGETHWQSLSSALPLLVWTASSDGAVDHFGAQGTAYTGLVESELIGHGWLSVIHADDREATERAWSEAMAQRSALEIDHRLRRADGAYRWFTTRAVVVPERAGLRWLVTASDVHARKQLEEELQRAKDRLELAVRSSGVVIWEYDMPDGVLATARLSTPNLYEFLGYDPLVDALPEPSFDLIHPDDLDEIMELNRAYLAGEANAYEVEHRVKHKDGSYRWVLGRGLALRDATGVAVRFVGTSVDITELKRISDDLERAREAAEGANRAKDDFLANVSHEIRTPMNAILGMTELCLDTAESARQKQLLATVRSAASHLLTLIDDLLDFSKINAGKLRLDVSDFALRPLLEETIAALAVRAQRKGLRLTLDVHPEVTDQLSGDAGRLRQILMNLVGNGIKFTSRGEVGVQVAEEPAAEGVRLRFSVRDTGIGIAREKQAAIFRAFEQEDTSTTREYGGTGLGLTISAQLVALMGGEIALESERGQGSRFCFSVCFGHARTGASSRDRAAAVLPPWRLERPSRALRILVAEDNELNSFLMRELLTRGGHIATFATSGPLALELASSQSFDLLLLDLHLPEMDGFAIARAIRERERETGAQLPIVAVTARSSEADRARCAAAGMNGFLAKPIEATELAEVLTLAAAGPAGAADSMSLLDREVILRACAGDARTLARMSQVVQKTLPEQVARVSRALARGEATALREAVHRLHGTLGTFSSVAGALALQLEESAERADLECCAVLFARLKPICEEFVVQTGELTLNALRR